MVKKIVLVNPKGGSGKTTIAINLAAHYAASGRRVTLVDLDPQGSSSRWLAKRPDSSQHIHGIAGFNTPTGVTRSFVMAIPPEIERIVVDTPAGLSGQLHCIIERLDDPSVAEQMSRQAGHFWTDLNESVGTP